MGLNPDQIITIAVAFLAPLVLAGANRLLSASTEKGRRRREMIASANKSVMKRIELCYRILRRVDGDLDDQKAIRDIAHDVQEENEYYKGLLLSESLWFGSRYSQYISSIQKLTAEPMKLAWSKKGDPAAEATNLKLNHEKISDLSNQFMADSRRFLNPLWRIRMHFLDRRLRSMKKKVGEYDVG